MRSRSTLCLFVFLLLIASLAGAVPPAGPSSPAIDVAPSPEDPSCNPLLAKLGISPISSAENATTTFCGACSVTVCRGAAYNSICQGGSVVKRCIAAFGLDCSADGLPQCQCWSGPLP